MLGGAPHLLVSSLWRVRGQGEGPAMPVRVRGRKRTWGLVLVWEEELEEEPEKEGKEERAGCRIAWWF